MSELNQDEAIIRAFGVFGPPVSVDGSRLMIEEWNDAWVGGSERALAIRLDDEFAGVISAKLHDGGLAIVDLRIRANARGRKVGARAIHLFIDHLVASGCELIRLETDASNAAAIGLNEYLGFRLVGDDPGQARYELKADEWPEKSASVQDRVDAPLRPG